MRQFRMQLAFFRPATRFSDINMQRDEARDGNDDAFFSTIDFAKTYHEGGFGGDASIGHHRAAEVLCESPLLLTDHLKWVVCRSEAERETLLHLAGTAGRALRPKVVTSDDGKVFEKRFAFVEKVYVSPEGVSFNLSPRHDWARLKVRIQVEHAERGAVFDETYPTLLARSENGGGWISRTPLRDGNYLVRIHVDDHLAYENQLVVGEVLF